MEFFLYAPCAILFVVSSLYLLRIFADARRNLPPGPWPLPFIGNLLDLGTQPHRSLARLAERHGPLMTLRLGAVTTIVVSSADAARDVFQHHDAALSARSVPASARVCDSDRLSVAWIPTSDPLWRAIRKVCSAELFSPSRINGHESLRREKLRDLVSDVTRLSSEGAAVDVGGVAFATVLSLLSRTIFSSDLDGRGGSGKFREAIVEFSVTVAVPNLSDFFPAVAPLDPQRLRKRLARVFQRLHAIFDEQIERRMLERDAGEPPKNDFLNVLLDYRSPEDGRCFDRQTLRTLLTDLLSAGTDSSAVTVEWAMAELLQNPTSMAKARQELAQVIGTKSDVEESDLANLKYLQAIVKEVFRLHPVAPFLLPRQAVATTELGGYTVPKGTRVLLNVWAIGRDSKLWTEPEKFMPERFMDMGRDIDYRGRDFELIPFGAGRRVCPGMPLAMRTVHLMLATLLYRFEWRLPVGVEATGVDMTEKFGTTLGRATPLHAMAQSILFI